MKIAVFYDNISDGVLTARRSLEDVLAQFKSEGMDKLYVSIDSWKRDGHVLAGMMTRLNIGLEGMYCHCDFLNQPASSAYRAMISLAADCGADHLLLVPQIPSAGNTPQELEIIVDGMARAVVYGREKGVHILMENCDSLLVPNNCIAGLQHFMQQIDGLECAFDTGNFITYHEDEMAALELFMPRIYTMHLKDRCPSSRHLGDIPRLCADGQKMFCCPIGSGLIHIKQILAFLKERQYPGDVIVELFYCDQEYLLEDISTSIRWLRSQGIG